MDEGACRRMVADIMAAASKAVFAKREPGLRDEVIRRGCRFYSGKRGRVMQMETRMKSGAVEHTNRPLEEAADFLCGLFFKEYAHMYIYTPEHEYMFMRNGGGVTMRRNVRVDCAKSKSKQQDYHDRERNYIIKQGEAFLRELRMADDGGVFKSHMNKYRQINRYAEYIADAAKGLDGNITVWDMCCGRGYLSFAAYVCLTQLGYGVRFYGMDLKPNVIEECNDVSRRLGYDMTFIQGDIARAGSQLPAPDLAISLHACDTATDIALWQAVRRNAAAIIAAPCCQHEVAAQLEVKNAPAPLLDVIKYNSLRQRYADILTDAIRCNILEAFGYNVNITEFIETEHTHKNLAIIATSRGAYDANKMRRVKELCASNGVHPMLMRLCDV